ncbi:DUF835 domain-containing protein [Pyrococcus kukulkanii]|uniref:DUF835 domain-containing protein n=1 Tax=Pyrococcus kukulkanii TaxID=1609559 RepID=UPI001379B2A9|nr:DUF835 domain-containing protein [Pyrococcus kukulkanii]
MIGVVSGIIVTLLSLAIVMYVFPLERGLVGEIKRFIRIVIVSLLLLALSGVFIVLEATYHGNYWMPAAVLIMTSYLLLVSEAVKYIIVFSGKERRGTGGAYIIRKDEDVEFLVHTLSDSGIPVLLITRKRPDSTRRGVQVIWVSRVGDGVSPTDLHRLLNEAIKFLSGVKGKGVVVVDCVEFLLLYNEFKAVAKFLFTLKDHVLMSGGFLIIGTSPEVIGEREFNVLREEFPEASVEKVLSRLLPQGLFGIVGVQNVGGGEGGEEKSQGSSRDSKGEGSARWQEKTD